MQVTLWSWTKDGETVAMEAATTCTRGKNGERALEMAIKSGHESVLEHASMTFRIEGVSRALLAQLTRHRIASFSVESQRYCDLNEIPVVMPDSIKMDETVRAEWESVMARIREFYRWATKERGIPREDARYLTPQAAETRLMLTMNARELRHFFELRCCHRAQWEIQELANAMLRICKEWWPRIFRDAGPGCARGRCPEERPCGRPWKEKKHEESMDGEHDQNP